MRDNIFCRVLHTYRLHLRGQGHLAPRLNRRADWRRVEVGCALARWQGREPPSYRYGECVGDASGQFDGRCRGGFAGVWRESSLLVLLSPTCRLTVLYASVVFHMADVWVLAFHPPG